VELLVNYHLPVGLVLGALLALPAVAKEGDTFRPFVSAGYFYDSNLFRLADDEGLGAQRDDRYNVLSAGIDVDWKPGRQQIVANATKTWIRYDRYTYLDFDGDDIQATWNWRLGNRLSGNVGAAKSTSMSNFEDVGLAKNVVDRERRFGRVEWEFDPRWRIGGGVEEVDNTNSSLDERSQDFHQQAYDVVLSYRTPKGSKLRAQVRRIDSDFPNLKILGVNPFPPIVALADNSYQQDEYLLLGDWSVSGKLTLRGQAGWVERQYKNVQKGDLPFPGYDPLLVPRPDFSGFVGRMSGDWYATGKTLVSASLYREPGGAQDINASSVMRTGASVKGVWLVREKWRMNAGVTFENRDFRGDPDPAAVRPQRNDDTLGASLSLSYMPIQAVSLDVGAMAGRRDSNYVGEDYEFHSMFVNVRADF
jgi:exopolysaccharide biosynthesis operon protein EpsL